MTSPTWPLENPDRARAYDVVIVGAGTAGCILAARLSEDPARRVLLIESGHVYRHTSLMPDFLRYGSHTEADADVHRAMWEWPTVNSDGSIGPSILSGKVLGGGSSVNGQVWLRPMPDDFERWAAWGLPSWGWKQIQPYFDSLEDDLDFPRSGPPGPVPVARIPRARWSWPHEALVAACQETGHALAPNLNTPAALGVGAQPFNNRDGIRVSTAMSHLDVALSRPNLTVVGDATVTRLRFAGNRVTGVVARLGDSQSEIEAEKVILSAGSIGSPTLLLRSGIGPAEHLRASTIDVVADLPGVGSGIEDHPYFALSWPIKEGRPSFENLTGYPLAARLTAPGSPSTGDIKISMSAGLDDGGSGHVKMIVALQLAASTGTLRLNPKDSTLTPLITPGYLKDPYDFDRLAFGVRHALDISRCPSLDGALGEPEVPTDPEELGALIRSTVRATYHPTSTCAMGLDPSAGAVTDESGHVHGVEGLLVVDASIMPSNVRANINATVAVVAEKIAHELRQGRRNASREQVMQ